MRRAELMAELGMETAVKNMTRMIIKRRGNCSIGPATAGASVTPRRRTPRMARTNQCLTRNFCMMPGVYLIAMVGAKVRPAAGCLMPSGIRRGRRAAVGVAVAMG